MAKSSVTYIRIPVHLLGLGVRSAHELALLGLAVGFNGKGIRLSNAELARLLGADRRNIPRLVGRLVEQGYLWTEIRDGRRMIHPTDIILKSPPDFNFTTKCLQSDDEVTSDLPCPYRSEVTKVTETPARTSSPKALEDDALFRRFWGAYPKKVAKVDARKAWAKLHPDADLAERIIAGVESYAATEQWQREGRRYVPNPATFLNKRRWEDEVEPVTVGAALGCGPCDEDEAWHLLKGDQ